MAMKEATLKKRAAAKLRKAYKTMNDDGAHWIQGFMAAFQEEKESTLGQTYTVTHEDQAALDVAEDPKKCQFCSVGGLRMACFGSVEPSYDEMSDDPLYATALAALVARITRRKTVDVWDGERSIQRPISIGEVAEHAATYGYCNSIETLEGIVIDWNDTGRAGRRRKRSWREIENGFLRAAESLEA